MIHVALTSEQRDVLVVALRSLDDRLRNDAFDFSLEPEFQATDDPPSGVAVLELLQHLKDAR